MRRRPQRLERALDRLTALALRLQHCRRLQGRLLAEGKLARFRPWGWILLLVSIVYGLRCLSLVRSIDRRRRALRAGRFGSIDIHRPARRAAFKEARDRDGSV